MAAKASDASAKWLASDSGARYESERFQSSRARDRDAACVRGLLDEVCGQGAVGRVLDVPCGSGRLTRLLAGRAASYAGVDASRAMLEASRPAFDSAGPRTWALEADGFSLPLSSGQFDVVVACRWLHHLHEEAALRAAIVELVRVSRSVVIASFWDERSLPGWRRFLHLKRAEGPAGRVATSRERIAALFSEAGADIVSWRATLRFVSQQTFVAARVRRTHS